jgi:hypothetical protein
MKRFKWPLQRLLDVTAQRELALRAELFALSRDIARRRQAIVTRRAALRATLAELDRQRIEQRIPQQEVFMAAVATDERTIARLKKKLAEMESLRAEKTRQFMKVKASRQTLERLREEARRRHRKEMELEELKQLDESSQISYVRKVMAAHIRAAS